MKTNYTFKKRMLKTKSIFSKLSLEERKFLLTEAGIVLSKSEEDINRQMLIVWYHGFVP